MSDTANAQPVEALAEPERNVRGLFMAGLALANLGIMIAFVAGNGYFMGYKITGMILLLCILGREFMVSGLRMVAATKGTVIEADASGKVKTFIQLNAIGWLLGARMLAQDFGDLFAGDARWQVTAVHGLGLGLFVLSAVLTVTSGYTYFRKHGHVVLD